MNARRLKAKHAAKPTSQLGPIRRKTFSVDEIRKYVESGPPEDGEEFARLICGERPPAGLCNGRAIGDNLGVKTSRYFEEQVLRKRSYLRREWCERVMVKPLRVEVQPNGRVRYWGVIPELGARVLRVITLGDGETVHNAFPDRGFKL